MATPTIPNGEEHFFPIIYEGNGGGQRVGKFVPFTDNGTIDNSCIFNKGDSAQLERTPSSNGNRRTFTVSAWVKRGVLGTEQHICSSWDGSSTDNNSMWEFRFLTANTLSVSLYTTNVLITNRTFEDTSKFYHVLMAVDTTQATANDRVKLYVDGDEITSFSTDNRSSAVSQNFDTAFNNTADACVVGNRKGASLYFDGYMAEVNMIDGQALLPASFGQTDTSTGRWIPSVVKPYPTTTTTFTVTVADVSGNKYYIDSSQQATVTLIEGATYRFDQSDSSNSGHPLRFSTTSDGTHGGGTEFTSGVTTVGTPGSSGAYTEITVPTSTATLYYYCTQHSGMGGTANTQDQYGTNGFRLQFGTSSAMGTDTANSNDFSLNNIDATNQTTDSPTQNFATFDPNDDTGTMPLSEGNREVTQSGSSSGAIRGTLAPSSGKYYFEFTAISVAGSDGQGGVGIQLKNESVDAATSIATIGANTYIYRDDGYMINDGDGNSGFTNYGSGAIIGVALDLDNNKLYFSYSSGAGTDGVFENSGDPVAGTGAIYTLPSNQRFAPYLVFKGSSGQNYSLNTGQTSFNTTPPTGFSALQQDNLPETAKGVSGLVWMKNRDAADNHQWYDSSRGKHIYFKTNSTAAESTATDGLQKFLAGGQQIEDNAEINTAGESIVSWNWVCNGATEVTNNDGSNTTTVQANTTAGFSIVKFTPPSSGFDAITYGHGLTQTPEWFLWKRRNSSMRFLCYHKSAYEASNGGHAMELSASNANSAFNVEFGSTAVFTSAPTATTFALRNNSVTAGGAEHMAYCWHSVDGFSKFGKYTGNGSSDGTFVATNFSPSFVMIKSSSHATSWYVFDNKRNPINPAGKRLVADGTFVEDAGTTEAFDFLSNGFKLRNTSSGTNGSGRTYIYMAFAENPFVGDGTSPVTAR